jgi:hypothetical protein
MGVPSVAEMRLAAQRASEGQTFDGIINGMNAYWALEKNQVAITKKKLATLGFLPAPPQGRVYVLHNGQYRTVALDKLDRAVKEEGVVPIGGAD